MRYVILFLVFWTSLVSAADPAWIHGGGFERFKDARYLTAVGEGQSANDARKSAISGLAEQLKVSIRSQSDIVKEYRSTNSNVQKSERMNVQISTQVNLDNIEGIKVVEQYFKTDSNTYYAFAVLDKVKNATDLAFRIESDFEQIRSQLDQSINLINGGQASDGINALIKTTQRFPQLTSDIELHKLFGQSGANSLLKEQAQKLITDVDGVLGQVIRSVNVQVVNGAEKPGSPELGVAEPYQLMFSYGSTPLSRVPVRVEADFANAVINTDPTTDANGMLNVYLRSFDYSDQQLNKMTAYLDVYDDLFLATAPRADLIVLLSQKSEVSVQLKTSLNSPDNEFLYLNVNDGLASVLSSQNYNVLTDEGNVGADYIVEVKGSVVDMPGFNGMFFSKINGVVQIRSGKSGRTLKTIRIKANDTKAGGLSNSVAAEKASGKLVKAIENDLLETLEKNLGRN